jgi:UDP-N-acetylglucosamine--N-acetylmuramyl-(pentapeptide) pyrophosphoryl-undecaprenol N-acetylglucosamine transferase
MFQVVLLSKEWILYMHLLLLSRAGSVISVNCIVLESRSFYSFSNVAEDHQTKNAKAIVDKRSAFIERI